MQTLRVDKVELKELAALFKTLLLSKKVPIHVDHLYFVGDAVCQPQKASVCPVSVLDSFVQLVQTVVPCLELVVDRVIFSLLLGNEVFQRIKLPVHIADKCGDKLPQFHRVREVHAVRHYVLPEKCIVKLQLFEGLALLFEVVKFLLQLRFLIFDFGLKSDVALLHLHRVRVQYVSVFYAWSPV